MSAAKPWEDWSSVVFFVGTRGATAVDPFLDQASRWVDAIVAAVAQPACVRRSLGPAVAVAAAITQAGIDMEKVAETTPLPNDVLDARFGGMRGNSLVFVTHGLAVDPNETDPTIRKQTSGLLFHNATTGRNASDIVMQRLHLDNMIVDGNGTVVADPKLDPADPVTAQVRDFALVVDAIRQSSFFSIYLAACGGGDSRLGAFTYKLWDLTGRNIFYNSENINLPAAPAAPYAQVGSVWPADNAFHLSRGYPVFAPRESAYLVDLESKTDTFLPGSSERVWSGSDKGGSL